MKEERYYNSLNGKRILVAGGTGLVGANLTKKLVQLRVGVSSTFFSNKPPFSGDFYKKFDFTELNDCINATKDMDCVVICAAQTFGVKHRQKNPSAYILPNLKIYAGILEACRLNNVEKVIFISSSTVYQEANFPIREEQLDLNKPPYDLYFGVGWVNRYIEQLATLYFKEYGMEIGIVRPTNIYGPYDKFDEDKSNVIPALIKRALNKETPYVVWGDGLTVRDFIYVDDFVEDLLDILDGYCICDPINIGSGESIKIKEAVNIILDICGHDTIPKYDKTKYTAIPYRALDITKFKSIFGKKKRTPFKEGILKTVDWYKSTIDTSKNISGAYI